MMAGQGTSVVVQTLYFIVLARLLGATQYGILAGATALIAVASQYSSLGSGFVFLRHVSPDLSKFRLYWGYVLTTTLLGGSVIVIVVVLASHWLLHNVSPIIILCLALGDGLFGQITSGAAKVFQTFERMHFTAFINLLTNTLRLCAAVILLMVLHRATATNWAVALMSVSCVAAVIASVVVTRFFGKPNFSFSLVRRHTGEGILFSSTISTSSIYNDIDKVLLGHYGMNVANGIYTMAYRAVDTTFMAIRSIHAAAFPRFCREGAGGISQTRKFARTILGKTFWISLAIGALLFVTAPLIPIIVGKGFATSVIALRWLCLIPVLRSFHLSAGDALAGAGYQRFRFRYELCAAVGNLGINMWLIPRYSWRGATFSSLATDGALALVSWITLNVIAERATERHSATSLASAVGSPGSGN
jgi:O-antigen/teichoic acid export membrane protein